MARIYIGRSTGIGSFERHVVLKMILPEKANDHTAVQMFLDEARLAASLNHQNVAQVFEVGEDGGVHFLAMEYVHGQDLRALLAKAGSEGTRVPLELALTVVAGAAAGLNHAHERRTSDGVPMGIVHRDVSPSNIMIGYDGAVKLLDFGIAKAASRSVETQSGIIKGKFAYMAPEQCRGRDVDRRSDVFSLGIILYEVTTQHRCFRADSDFDTMHRIVTGDVVRPTRLVHGYPQALEAIVMKALAIDQHQRYQSAGLLLEAVESFAVAARMSLSTMSLGRFMREMFGDVQEPWLVPGRINPLPQPKEHTISNTNATGGGRPPARQSTPPQPQPPPPQPPQLPLLHEEAPLHLPPGASLLDNPNDQLPYAPQPYDHQSRDHLSHDRQSRSRLPHDVEGVSRSNVSRSNAGAVGWTGQEYPSAPQGYASAAMPPPEEHPSAVHPPHMASQSSISAMSPAVLAGGTPQIPPSQFAVQSGSTSGPAHNALPLGSQLIARTQQDYTGVPGPGQNQSQSGISYPSYEPPHDPDADVDLQPSNRLLYIGVGVVLVGIIIVLAISIIKGRSDDATLTKSASSSVPGVMPGSDEPNPEATNPEAVKAGGMAGALKPDAVKPEAFRPEMTAQTNEVDAGVAPISDESIRIHVVSVPPGADVLLAGKPIGMTPLDTKIRRSTGLAMLTVHHAKFEDMKMTIDLSGDFKRELTLTSIPEETVKPPPPIRETSKPPVSHTQTHDGGGRPHPPPTPAPPAKKCQPPDKYNPFDTACGGQPCPPCK